MNQPKSVETFQECDTCSAKSGSPILCTGCLHNRQAIVNLTTYTEQRVREERDSIIRILEKIDYDVDVNKEPTIADEAWANQYDSKAEAFWYGEAEGMKALKGAIKVIQQITQSQP